MKWKIKKPEWEEKLILHVFKFNEIKSNLGAILLLLGRWLNHNSKGPKFSASAVF